MRHGFPFRSDPVQILLDGATMNGPEQELMERYLKRIPPPFKPEVRVSRKPVRIGREPVVLLDVEGERFDSPGFARWLAKRDRKTIFVIGGAYGFVTDWPTDTPRISLGEMTLPHKLAVAVFAEQLYRAYTYTTGHPYHH